MKESNRHFKYYSKTLCLETIQKQLLSAERKLEAKCNIEQKAVQNNVNKFFVYKKIQVFCINIEWKVV